MKKFILSLALLFGLSFAFSKQYVDYKFFIFDFTSREIVVKSARKCSELIADGYKIVSVALNENGYVIVYEDDNGD